jgi:hypothetical protein
MFQLFQYEIWTIKKQKKILIEFVMRSDQICLILLI